MKIISIILSFCVSVLPFSVPLTGTGNVFPGTGENVDRAGSTAWGTPENIVSDNTTDATCTNVGSDYLVGRNYGFTIPAGSAITGIIFRMEVSEHSPSTESIKIQLQDASGALFGNEKSQTVNGTGKTIYTLGTSTDLWGTALTAAIVNDVDFGVRVWYLTSHTVNIDFFTVEVHYAIGTSNFFQFFKK